MNFLKRLWGWFLGPSSSQQNMSSVDFFIKTLEKHRIKSFDARDRAKAEAQRVRSIRGQ